MSGTRGSVDFVELHSHLFEHFVMDTSALRRYLTDDVDSLSAAKNSAAAKNSGDGAKLEKALAAYSKHKNSFSHIDATQQLLFALVDQAFYSCDVGGVDIEQMQESISSTLKSFPHIDQMVDLEGELHSVPKRATNESEASSEEKNKTSLCTLQNLLAPVSP